MRPVTFCWHDVGDNVLVWWDDDGCGIHWQHLQCVNGRTTSAWMPLRFRPDPASTGHVLVAGDPASTDKLTIQGSLLCPAGCGKHGEIKNGRWIPA